MVEHTQGRLVVPGIEMKYRRMQPAIRKTVLDLGSLNVKEK